MEEIYDSCHLLTELYYTTDLLIDNEDGSHSSHEQVGINRIVCLCTHKDHSLLGFITSTGFEAAKDGHHLNISQFRKTVY